MLPLKLFIPLFYLNLVTTSPPRGLEFESESDEDIWTILDSDINLENAADKALQLSSSLLVDREFFEEGYSVDDLGNEMEESKLRSEVSTPYEPSKNDLNGLTDVVKDLNLEDDSGADANVAVTEVIGDIVVAELVAVANVESDSDSENDSDSDSENDSDSDSENDSENDANSKNDTNSITRKLSSAHLNQNGLTKETLESLLVEPISDENLNCLKYLIGTEQLKGLISETHIKKLFQNPSGNSLVILKLLYECPWFEFECKSRIEAYVNQELISSRFDLEKFKQIWAEFKCKHFPDSYIVSLLFRLLILFLQFKHMCLVYYFILEEISGLSSFRAIFNELYSESIIKYSAVVLESILPNEGPLSYLDIDQKIEEHGTSLVKSLWNDPQVRSNFLGYRNCSWKHSDCVRLCYLQNLFNDEISFSYLETDQKIKALHLFTFDNRVLLIKSILKDPLVRTKVLASQNPPWMDAVIRDHPESVEAYLHVLPEILEKIVEYAVSKKNTKILEYLKEKGFLIDGKMIFELASNSIQGNDLNTLKNSFKLGLDLNLVDSRGYNLLDLAFEFGNRDIIKYLVETFEVTPNTRLVTFQSTGKNS